MKKTLFLVLAGMLICATTAFAQTGSVIGTVVDSNGAPVADARVSLHQGDVCLLHVLTDADGQYEFSDVPVGIYLLKAGKPRVGNAVVEEVEVIEGQITEVPTITLTGSGPHGPKFQFQNEHQNEYQGE